MALMPGLSPAYRMNADQSFQGPLGVPRTGQFPTTRQPMSNEDITSRLAAIANMIHGAPPAAGGVASGTAGAGYNFGGLAGSHLFGPGQYPPPRGPVPFPPTQDGPNPNPGGNGTPSPFGPPYVYGAGGPGTNAWQQLLLHLIGGA